MVHGVDYLIISPKYCAKTAIGYNSHNGGGSKHTNGGGKEALFGIKSEHRGNQRACPRARSGERNGNKKNKPPIGILLDGSLVFFDFAVKPRGSV